jgi:hypothetical protein
MGISNNTMITARVRSMISLDVDGPLSSYVPADPEQFNLLVRVLVGPHPSEGEESFDIAVCTPSWLAGECERSGWVSGQHTIIVSEYVWPVIEAAIKKLVEQHSGASWREVASKVSQLGQWEFADYRESS